MSDTFEDRIKCPQCGITGDPQPVEIRSDATVYQVFCVTKLCRWYDTTWLVERNADGTVPPITDHRNQTPRYIVSKADEERAKRLLENLQHYKG